MRCIFMAKKKIAYIQFPGSNTENETKNILQKHGMLPFGHFWNDPSELLNDFDGFIILGGFSLKTGLDRELLHLLSRLLMN